MIDAKTIEQHGQMLIGVIPEQDAGGFMYTVGNALQGLPELLLIGSFDPGRIGLALNQLGQKMRDEGAPLPEGMVDIDWTYPFKVRKCGPEAKTKYTIQVGQIISGTDYEVLQVMICDKDGRYPGDEGCDAGFNVYQP